MSGFESAARSFRDGFAGEIVLPEDPEYDSARRVWNAMVDRRPRIVLRPADAAAVASAIRFAREHGLTIAVRGGGHSIPGFSTCDDGAVIDLSRMRGVEVDRDRRVARANGGALLGELDAEAQRFGLVCPVGVVSHTGVAGLTLGGGMGRLQRRHGLTIDNLHAVELVTAEGASVRASEDEHADLFWGLRGAGANFGIATSFEFRLHPLEHPVTYGVLFYGADRAADLAAVVRETLDRASDDLWLGYSLGLALPADEFPPDVAGLPIARLSVMHSGPAANAERELEDLQDFGPPVRGALEPKPYLVTQRLFDGPMEWGHRFYMKSGFARELSADLVDVLLGRLSELPEGTDGGVSTWACGGAISTVPDEATAYTGRDGAFWISTELQWDDPGLDERARAWVRDVLTEIDPFLTTGRYVNDVADVGEQEVRSVYGDAKLERLVGLKRAWDPENVFRLNQNVRP